MVIHGQPGPVDPKSLIQIEQKLHRKVNQIMTKLLLQRSSKHISLVEFKQCFEEKLPNYGYLDLSHNNTSQHLQ